MKHVGHCNLSATAVTTESVGHARLVSLQVRDDVPLGTPVTIVTFCHVGRKTAGQVLDVFPTIVGSERAGLKEETP